MEYIRLNNDSVFRLGIKDKDGNVKVDENGKEICLEFDLEDIEAPVKYNKCDFLVKKAQNDLRMKLNVIDKKPDKKGKYLLSSNEEEKVKAMQDYFKSLEEAMDLFLGQGGTKKVFGNRRYWTMWDDLNDMIEPFLPKMKTNFEDITKKIKNKYSNKETDVLKDE